MIRLTFLKMKRWWIVKHLDFGSFDLKTSLRLDAIQKKIDEVQERWKSTR